MNILIAEDNDVSRELMASVLRTHGYGIYGAIDGDSAIEVIDNNDIDMALVDINMAPKGGFEFIKHLVVNGNKMPVVIVTGDDSSDILMEANSLGVTRVIQKPVDPARLLELVKRIVKRHGLEPKALAVSVTETTFSPEDLMQKTIERAEKNAEEGRGGPFAAIVTDETGHILGEGANGTGSRVDPTAHAEVMAIRQAAEKLGRTGLSNCTLYCSSEPTMMGKALIASVGIEKVYYGLSHADISAIVPSEKRHHDTDYEQLGQKQAMEIFKAWNQDQD